MDDLLSEKEQIEQMRTWWSEYGNYVIGGIVLGAAILFGYNYVQNARLEAQYAASSLYDELADVVVDADMARAEAIVGELTADYPDSNYAAQAKLAMARLYMDENRDQDAADILDEIVSGNADAEFKQVATIRLAKIYLYQDKAEEALALLDVEDAGAFAARYADVRGDAYVALGQLDDAREAYQLALAESGQSASVDQQFVQLKLLDLPIETFAGAGDEADGDGDAEADPMSGAADEQSDGDETTVTDEEAE